MQLPITEKVISERLGRAIHSPIVVDSIARFEGIEAASFLEYYRPLFAELNWDYYDVRRLQLVFLEEQFPNDKEQFREIFKAYYSGKAGKKVLHPWLSQLSAEQLANFEQIQPWRRRSVSRFSVAKLAGKLMILQEAIPQFKQDLDSDDFRSLPRVFDPSPDKHVNNQLFYSLLEGVFGLVARTRKTVKRIGLTAHFMSVKATSDKAGDNSPEGAHEDGADYIVSALVVNRINLKGGQSQVIEQVPSGEKVIICEHTLQAGEFIYQADSRDELIYGTDLWHHVTPFYLDDASKGEGWRDIIGFDINVLEE